MIPAIDLMDGQCVRLVQGKKDSKIVYSDNPEEIAVSFEKAGARRLHIVDLDGAFEGEPKNQDAVKKIRNSVNMKIEVGGGIRKTETIREYVKMGIDFVILGTRAMREHDWLKDQIDHYGQAVIVGLDAKDGMLASHGWTKTENITAADFALELETIGLKTIIYTDISRDGMLTGPNLPALSTMANTVHINVIASGGVHTLKDVENIKNLRADNITGIISGKAIYEKTLVLEEAIEVLGG